MCLAVPGKLIEITNHDPVFRTGKVDFGGVIREVNLAFVPEAEVGNYVNIHVGVAISILDEDEARKIFEELKMAGNIDNQLEFPQ